MNEFMIVLNNDQSKSLYDKNNLMDYKVRLNKPLVFREKGWKVCLLQYDSPITQDMLVCSNICSYSLVGDDQLRLLRLVTADDRIFAPPIYVPLSVDYIETIHIYLVPNPIEGKDISPSNYDFPTNAVLHFKYIPDDTRTPSSFRI
jgi:hypothetical protein